MTTQKHAKPTNPRQMISMRLPAKMVQALRQMVKDGVHLNGTMTDIVECALNKELKLMGYLK